MSLTLAEAQHRARIVADVRYAIHLDLTAESGFESRTRVEFAADPGTQTFIELAGATELEATLNGVTVMAAYDGRRIPLTGLLAHNVVEVTARLPYVTDGDGMHTFTDPADGERYVSAYCGMDIAHRVFACFDQPDLKAPISLTVTAPAGWTVLANGRPTGPAAAPLRRFAATPPISTYLFVVCAGPWHSIRWEHHGLGFGWHARRSLAAELDRDAVDLRAITEACFDYYTDHFEEPFPFDGYDQVFVPGHNWGALETPGCVTFRDEYLFRDGGSAAQRQGRAVVIAHEMAHMWFGDLVTMRWWEDSWLNESFADYMGFRVASIAGFPDSWAGCALTRKPTAYRADVRRSTHPVAADAEQVVDVDTAFGNFDMITYAKGSAVLRQLVTWLGEPEFLAGVNRYLTGHRFGNADLNDFLTALDAVSDRDVLGWANAWLRTTGFDIVRVEREDDVPVLTRIGSRPHRLTVIGYADGWAGPAERLVDLADEPIRLPELAGRIVVPDPGDQTYAALDLDDEAWAAVTTGLGTLTPTITRARLWLAAIERARGGEVDATVLLDLVARHLPAEPDPVLFEAVTGQVLSLILGRLLTPPELRPAEAVLAALGTQVWRSGRAGLTLPALRLVATTTGDPDVITGWLAPDGPAGELPNDLRWLFIRRLMALGGDPAWVDQEQRRDPSSAGRLAALTARAARPDPAAKAAAWDAMTTGEPSNREFLALAEGLWSWGHGDLVAPYLDAYLAAAPHLAQRGQAFADVVGDAFPWLPLPTDQLQTLRTDLAGALPHARTVLHRAWSDHLDDLDQVLGARARRPEVS